MYSYPRSTDDLCQSRTWVHTKVSQQLICFTFSDHPYYVNLKDWCIHFRCKLFSISVDGLMFCLTFSQLKYTEETIFCFSCTVFGYLNSIHLVISQVFPLFSKTFSCFCVQTFKDLPPLKIILSYTPQTCVRIIYLA